VRYQSTDMLREVMRMMIPERLMPVLHRSSFNAGDALPVEPCNENEGKAKESRMVAGFRTQAELLSVPCEAVIQRGLTERVSLILEGVHVQPNLLSQIPQEHDAVVVHVMMSVLKQKELKSVSRAGARRCRKDARNAISPTLRISACYSHTCWMKRINMKCRSSSMTIRTRPFRR